VRILHFLLSKSGSWNNVLDCGEINIEWAIEHGVSGPILRSTGTNYDLRKKNPFYWYKNISFINQLGYEGTSFDRYMIRVNEIIQSCDIVRHLVRNIPEEKKEMINFSVYEKKIEDGLYYFSSESANGESGVYLHFQNSILSSVRTRRPIDSSYQLFSKIICGNDCLKLKTIFSSLNLSAFEVRK
ncbi:hypothetical protein OAB57_04095, partial [Bacteriovoracaceae bacterium]|nr:hypothetical protein [Bacteriovoracaceae bacterium]